MSDRSSYYSISSLCRLEENLPNFELVFYFIAFVLPFFNKSLSCFFVVTVECDFFLEGSLETL